jgi:uncharacterized protein (UPF0335 family)
MNIDVQLLKGIVDEIEASRLRQKGETKHQRAIFERAAGKDLDCKAIRRVLQRRAMKEIDRDSLDHLVDSYELALGGKKTAAEAIERGATVRAAAKAGGISVGSAAAIKAAQETKKIEHDPETGEITTTPDGPTTVHNGGGDHDAGLVTQPESPEVARAVPPVDDPRTFDEIAGALPDRLRRERVSP